ncbi:ABC transporter substrate-binding protein [bacterium 3DAC]|nr:ABC transporter substrate-binding protein [bacterium 3DAC]
MKRKLAIFLLSLLLVSSLFITNVYSAVVVDDVGRVVRLYKTPKRIVSTAPSITEILFAIGAGDRVVGRTDFDNYPPEVKKIPSIGGFSTPSYEKIISLRPDLVISAKSFPKQLFDKLAAQLPVMVLDPHSLKDIANDIRKVGIVTGLYRNAQGVAFKVEAIERAVRAFTGNHQDKKVFFVLWYNPIMSTNKTTFIGQMLEDIKVNNIASDLQSPWPMVNPEYLLQNDPDIIIMPKNSMAYAGRPAFLNEFPWKDLKAVKNGNVYYVNDDWVFRPGPRIVYGLVQLAHIVQPTTFNKEVVAIGLNDRVYAKAYYKHELGDDNGAVAVYLNAEEGRTYISKDGAEKILGVEIGSDFVVYKGKTCKVKTDNTGIYIRLRDVLNCMGIKDVVWNGDYREIYLLLP